MSSVGPRNSPRARDPRLSTLAARWPRYCAAREAGGFAGKSKTAPAGKALAGAAASLPGKAASAAVAGKAGGGGKAAAAAKAPGGAAGKAPPGERASARSGAATHRADKLSCALSAARSTRWAR